MVKVAIPKTEYEQLKKQAAAYRKFVARFFESVIRDPIDEIVKDFRKTDLYTEEFLKDLGSGLRKSSLAEKHANKATQRRS